MTDHQHAKLSSYGEVDAVLTAHPEPLTPVPAAQRAIADFREQLGALRAAARAQAAYAPQGKAKAAIRDRMTDAAVALSQTVAVWAEDEGDVALADQIAFEETDFRRAHEQDALDLAALVHATAAEHLDALADYNVTRETVAALDTHVDAFADALGQPRHAIGERKAQTEAIERLFPAIDRLLQRRLDRFVAPFKGTPFYTEYHAARQIKDR